MTAIQTDRDALLRTVLEYPFDPTPRLIYADFLDDTDHGPGRPYQGMWWRDSVIRGMVQENTTFTVGPKLADTCVFDTLELTLSDFLRHAPAMFALHPVTRVRIADKRPHRLNQFPDLFFWNTLTNGDHSVPLGHIKKTDKALLPLEVFRRLSSSRNPHPPCERSYCTEADAEAALSRACVDHGRHAAGLRPIRWGIEDREEIR